ncbi:hypothetical protein M8J75_001023 [Diaphorina citri]|nr:hypothetical protein M8J75_001023 [Diaphorina citri]
MDEKNQLLITNTWLSLEWIDYNLVWNISEYGGVKDLRITPLRIWRPDILMYNREQPGWKWDRMIPPVNDPTHPVTTEFGLSSNYASNILSSSRQDLIVFALSNQSS